MLTYKNLYCSLVRSMSEAIDLYDEGKGILAREGLKKALLDAEDQVISHDIIPDEPISEKTSLAPHDSKARLLNEPTRRDSWRSHVHRT